MVAGKEGDEWEEEEQRKKEEEEEGVKRLVKTAEQNNAGVLSRG